jgi:predicted PurR-regulated permease PerM
MTIHGAFRLGLLGGLGVLTALLIGSAVTTLATVITYVGFALFLALGLDPIVRNLVERKVPRPLAIATVVVAVLGMFAGFVYALIPVVVEQVTNLYDSVLVFLTSYNSLSEMIGAVQAIIPIETLNVQKTVDSVVLFLSDPANLANIGGGVLSVGAGFANGILGAFLTLMLTIYLVIALPAIKTVMFRLVPASTRDNFTNIADQVVDAVGKYVIGQGTQGLANGVLSFIAMSLIGAEFPALFALIAFVFSLLPLVGTITGSLLIVLTQFLVDPTNPTTAIWVAVYYLVYLQIEAYVIGPYIMNRAVKVPGVLVIIAALAGGALMGVLGAIVAIPLAASLLIIVRQVIIPAQQER